MTDLQIPLRDKEEILWSGRPPAGIMFRRYDLFSVPFSLLWTGGVVFWTLIVYADIWPIVTTGGFKLEYLPFLIIGPIFVAVGFGFTFGRFVIDSRRRKFTYYAITNRRALIVSGRSGNNIDSIPISADLKIKVRGSLRGSIMFGEGYGFTAQFLGPGMHSGSEHPFMFERIENVREVYNIILDVQERVARRSS